MERFGFVFLVAGLGFFILAFAVFGWLPFVQFTDVKVQTIEELARNVPLDFIELRQQYPEAFKKAFGDKTDPQALAEALVIGRKVYIGEGCWHCHSQQVRPVGGDEARFGRVHYPEEFNNDLNYPVLWGTRRVGPDLLRESGRRSNDWHVAHFWNPPDVAPLSVMPPYPWFFETDNPATAENESLQPNKKGLCVIAYVQWLGSWINSYEETVFGIGAIDRSYPAPKAPHAAPTGKQPEPQTDADSYTGEEPYSEDNPNTDQTQESQDSEDEYGY